MDLTLEQKIIFDVEELCIAIEHDYLSDLAISYSLAQQAKMLRQQIDAWKIVNVEKQATESVKVSTSAVDTKSFAHYLEENADVIVDIVTKAERRHQSSAFIGEFKRKSEWNHEGDLLAQTKQTSGMKQIFVCGNYNGDNVIEVMANIRAGLRASKQILLAGHAPICPFLDFMYALIDGGEIPLEIFRAYCLRLIESSDYVYLIDSRTGKYNAGVEDEIKHAKDLNIKVLSEAKFAEMIHDNVL